MSKPKIVIKTYAGRNQKIYTNQEIDIVYRDTNRKVLNPCEEHTGIYTPIVEIVSDEKIDELMNNV